MYFPFCTQPKPDSLYTFFLGGKIWKRWKEEGLGERAQEVVALGWSFKLCPNIFGSNMNQVTCCHLNGNCPNQLSHRLLPFEVGSLGKQSPSNSWSAHHSWHCKPRGTPQISPDCLFNSIYLLRGFEININQPSLRKYDLVFVDFKDKPNHDNIWKIQPLRPPRQLCNVAMKLCNRIWKSSDLSFENWNSFS